MRIIFNSIFLYALHENSKSSTKRLQSSRVLLALGAQLFPFCLLFTPVISVLDAILTMPMLKWKQLPAFFRGNRFSPLHKMAIIASAHFLFHKQDLSLCYLQADTMLQLNHLGRLHVTAQLQIKFFFTVNTKGNRCQLLNSILCPKESSLESFPLKQY